MFGRVCLLMGGIRGIMKSGWVMLGVRAFGDALGRRCVFVFFRVWNVRDAGTDGVI